MNTLLRNCKFIYINPQEPIAGILRKPLIHKSSHSWHATRKTSVWQPRSVIADHMAAVCMVAIKLRKEQTWQDVPRLPRDIARRVVELHALHAAAAMGATVVMATTGLTPTPLTPRRRTAEVAESELAAPPPTFGPAGRERVQQWCTHLPRCRHSHRSAKPLRRERPSNPISETSSFAMHGTTGRGPPKSCMIFSLRQASKFGSARKT